MAVAETPVMVEAKMLQTLRLIEGAKALSASLGWGITAEYLDREIEAGETYLSAHRAVHGHHVQYRTPTT